MIAISLISKIVVNMPRQPLQNERREAKGGAEGESSHPT